MNGFIPYTIHPFVGFVSMFLLFPLPVVKQTYGSLDGYAGHRKQSNNQAECVVSNMMTDPTHNVHSLQVLTRSRSTKQSSQRRTCGAQVHKCVLVRIDIIQQPIACEFDIIYLPLMVVSLSVCAKRLGVFAIVRCDRLKARMWLVDKQTQECTKDW